VAANASSLPEVAGEAALLVPPEDDEALARAIQLLWEQPALARSMGEAGRRNAQRFRWDSCARETAAVYREAAKT
jgi:glycosyltransferase involved in cell wall biosynthesis